MKFARDSINLILYNITLYFLYTFRYIYSEIDLKKNNNTFFLVSIFDRFQFKSFLRNETNNSVFLGLKNKNGCFDLSVMLIEI